jgi:prevent-host-death family protein
VYKHNTVEIAALRQNLGVYPRRVERGEQLIVTDRNRPVAELGPPPRSRPALDGLIDQGRLSRATRGTLPAQL